MKIGIITFHGTWNCGAVLQCAALKRKLENMGHEAVVINYRPHYWIEKFKKYPNPLKMAAAAVKKSQPKSLPAKVKLAARTVAQTVYKYKPKSGRLTRKAKFEDFVSANLKQTKVYHTVDELRKDPPRCDVYISGSDQLWNPKLTNGEIDEAYFLAFGDESVKRVGYAISACQLDVWKDEDRLSGLLSGFDNISLRETDLKPELEKLYGRDIDICIDPTLLLQKEDYSGFEAACNELDEPYLLVYAFGEPASRELLFSTVKHYKEKYNLKVKVLSGPGKWPFEVDFYYPREGVSPGEFLSYIKNAELVITNSFHATVFSVLYEKEFYTVPVPGREGRIAGLLSGIGLSDRFIQTGAQLNDRDDGGKIDYQSAAQKLEKLRETSNDYLKRVLG